MKAQFLRVTSRFVIFGVTAAFLASALPYQSKTTSQSASSRLPAKWNEHYAVIPLSFEANRGQTDPVVNFMARGQGYSLFLTPTAAVLSLSEKTNSAVVRMQLKGSNPSARVRGDGDLPGRTNYLTGNNPANWRTNVPTYSRVRYDEVYPGIDLIYYGQQRELEYDFVVAPGAEPGRIRMLPGTIQDSQIKLVGVITKAGNRDDDKEEKQRDRKLVSGSDSEHRREHTAGS